MLKQIMHNITQKKLILLWIILASFVMIDITTRLTDNDSIKTAKVKIEKVENNSALMLEPEDAEVIIANINQYQIQTESDISNNEIMAEAEQNAQNGDLSQLYAGNFRFRLVGVFDKSELFAVIQQMDVTVNEQKLTRISTFERLQNYKVVKINSDKISLLSDDNRQITLFLYNHSEQRK
ncbi:MAG: hypothetical protein ACI9VT_002187 [Psychroserpens sp.]|jgi:hypothetical protein